MAQALYGQHPLDEYLKESGECRECVPGAFADALDDEPERVSGGDASVEFSFQCPSFTSQLQQWLSAIRHIFISPSDDFAERFKYDLISSNLLSTSVTSPLLTHLHPTIPMQGQLLPGELQNSQQDLAAKSNEDLKPLSRAFVIFGLAAFLSHHRLSAVLALIVSASFAKAPGIGSAKQSYIPQMFEALDSLKAVGSVWDAAVNDALTVIEREENSPYQNPSSSALPSPSSALRVALHSTLVTTQHQCDNVRPLLAALTSPLELSQLSEMYAPPSPSKPSFSLQTSPRYKHTSLPENGPTYPLRSPTSSSEKRQTWNGSRNLRPASIQNIKDRRRLSGLFSSPDAATTRPPTPSTPRSPSLAQVAEEEDEDDDPSRTSPNSVSLNDSNSPSENFGTAALYLRRKRRVSTADLLSRRASGLDYLPLSGSRSHPSLRETARPTHRPSSSLRFTSLSSVRHPFSLNSLHLALQGALASRRYACAHLLALRFSEDAEDETYWENVRSVTGLLVSTFQDAAARLNEALAVADDQKRQDGQPTPEGSTEGSPVRTPDDELPTSLSPVVGRNARIRSMSHTSKPSALLDLQSASVTKNSNSFAPVPNAVSRFASHVDAISTSLSDAKEFLLDCVHDLRDSSQPDPKTPLPSEESILESYERLRKELGYALRECERGKAALSDIFESRRLRDQPQDDVEEADDDTESSSGHVRFHMLSGSSKDSNDRMDPDPLTPGDGSPVMPTILTLEDTSNEKHVDDASQHLLLTSSAAHLPSPGLEQVFESESTALTSFNRERSKLPREERIRLMKAKRESMTGRGLAAHLEEEEGGTDSRKGWGPGTDVVQELKDVIWKVSERRRRLLSSSVTSAPALIPSTTTDNTSALDGSNDDDTPLCSL